MGPAICDHNAGTRNAGTRNTDDRDLQTVREEVRARYAAAARAAGTRSGASGGGGGCCGGGCCGDTVTIEPLGTDFGSALYPATERAELPAGAVAASLGCGNPTAVAELSPGETVLDLGSGGGIDVILSARRVGSTGKAYGLDMTEEMLALAQANATAAGVDNVEFLAGHMESIPLPTGSVDVVISNCVINLSGAKSAVFAEIARVLRPGGRIGISDIVAEDRLSPADRAERGDHAGCIAGALSESEYRAGLTAADFIDITVTYTHEVADGLHAAIVRARKPTLDAVGVGAAEEDPATSSR
jgi:arsenite methyltransferase